MTKKMLVIMTATVEVPDDWDTDKAAYHIGKGYGTIGDRYGILDYDTFSLDVLKVKEITND